MARRIALVLERFEPARGGTERYAAELLRRLRRRGHDVTVVAARVDRAALHDAPWLPVPVPAVPRAWRVWAFAHRAARLTHGRYDIVHGLQKSLGHTVFQPHTGSHAGSLAARRAAQAGVWARAWFSVGKWCSAKQWVFAAIERRQYAQRPAPLFVAIAPLVRRQMIERHRVPPDRIRLLPNPVDMERFRPATPAARAATRAGLGADPDCRVALFVGHEPRLKGLRAAVQAFAPGFAELWVAGAVPACDRQPAEAGSGPVVRWLGRVEDPAPLYGAADGLLLPTAYDPAPLTVLEALASGLPVCTTEACGLAELVRGSGGRVVADRNDMAGLRAAVAALASGPRPNEAFRAELARVHSWDAHLDGLEAIYEQATAG